MSISFIPNNSKRCTDPNLYSLKNIPNYQPQQIVYLPPLLEEEKLQQKQQFTDTSCQDKSIMIDKLIEVSADIIDSIWLKKKDTTVKIMPTSIFIREILKRSRATYSMLQLALFYIFRIKKIIFERMNQPTTSAPYKEIISCGRRIFLAALMSASKYINDKNYKNKTWSKIASLNVTEINTTEMIFLKLIDYQLYVSKPLYDKWVSLLHEHIQKKHNNYGGISFITMKQQEYHSTSYHTTTVPSGNLHNNNKTSAQPYCRSATFALQQLLSPVSYSGSSCNSSPINDASPSSSFSNISPNDNNNTPPLVYGSKRRRSFSTPTHITSKHLRQI